MLKVIVDVPTTECPDNFTSLSTNFVHRVDISCRNQVVTIMVLIDGIDVEVIPGFDTANTVACLIARECNVAM